MKFLILILLIADGYTRNDSGSWVPTGYHEETHYYRVSDFKNIYKNEVIKWKGEYSIDTSEKVCKIYTDTQNENYIYIKGTCEELIERINAL